MSMRTMPLARTHQRRADDGTEHRALPAHQARATQDGRGDGGQEPARADGGLAGIGPAHEHHARQGRQDAGEGVDAQLDQPHVDPGEPRRCLVPAHRVDVAAMGQASEYEGQQHGARLS